MKNTQPKKEQSSKTTKKKNKLPWWLGLVAELLIRMIKDSPERKRALQDLMIEQGVEFEIAKQEAKEAKAVAKHQRKLTEKKQRKDNPRKASTLKSKKHVVRKRIDGKWIKFFYDYHDDNGVITTTKELIPWGHVYDGRMRKIINE
jgi:predicted Holliday junction resolvase-like endonuclease